MYTYGSCPAGDEEFVRKLQAAYPLRLVAHQHPGDMCSLWSPRGYASLSGDACSALPQGWPQPLGRTAWPQVEGSSS